MTDVKTIYSKPGGRFIISLPSNPSTGYHWQIDKQSSGLRLVSTINQSNSKLIGASSETHWLWRVSSQAYKNQHLKYSLYAPGNQYNPVEVHHFKIILE